MDPATDFNTQVRDPARAAMLADNFAGAHKMAAVDQTPIQGVNDTELRTSIITSLNTAMVAAIDYFTPTLQGRSKFENRNTVYSSASLPQSDLDLINANIDRFGAAPSALNYMESYYNPTGDLRIPMVIIANERDPNVPAFHRAEYAARVATAGHSDLLFQRTITGFGHCVFTDAQFEAAFVALTQWVEQGLPPTP
jgi:pimeloyl-ACP methyl ester carboxylesterase